MMAEAMKGRVRQNAIAILSGVKTVFAGECGIGGDGGLLSACSGRRGRR